VYEQPWLVDYPCLYSPSGDFTVTYAVSTNSFVKSGIPVLAYGVEILWQETDFVSTTSSSTISLSPSSSTPSATLISQPNSLPSGAKAGIGAGVTVAGLFFIAALVFFISVGAAKARKRKVPNRRQRKFRSRN
jgi:hypothetical protein